MIDAGGRSRSGRWPFGARACLGSEAAALLDGPGLERLKVGERVRATRPLRNDGTYPHREVGAVLVRAGDVGRVVEIMTFRSSTSYTVEFVDRDIVIGARRWDLVRILDQG